MINKRNASVVKLPGLIIPRGCTINRQQAASSLSGKGLLAPGAIWIIILLVPNTENSSKTSCVLSVLQLAENIIRQSDSFGPNEA